MDVERVASHPCFNLCSLGSSCASKPACLGKHNGFSRRSGQTYLLVADRADLRISQLVWESLFFSDFPDVLDKLIRSWLIEPIYDLLLACYCVSLVLHVWQGMSPKLIFRA